MESGVGEGEGGKRASGIANSLVITALTWDLLDAEQQIEPGRPHSK